MGNKKIIYIVISLLVVIIGGYLYIISSARDKQPTRGNCLADECLAVNDLDYPAGQLPVEVKSALDEAILDEYRAQATYAAVISKYGQVRPFSMIIRAEEQHISSLKALYDKYGLVAPTNEIIGEISAPDSLKASCQTGVQAEIDNAKLYADKLLPIVKNYEDITFVFTNLMNASRDRHLPAFERCN